jgi:pantothenate kinase type III
MQSGLFYGYGCLCKGMIDLLSTQLSFPRKRESIKAVMTGGHTRLMKKFVSPEIRIIDEDLVFKGIYFLSGP